jgi:paraquat-inducible protein A
MTSHRAPAAPVIAEHRDDWLVCQDCGALQAVKPLLEDQQLVCVNCDRVLHFGRGPWLDTTTALAVAALILFICANAFTFFTLQLGAATQSTTILSGVGALIDREEWLLAALVLVTIFLLPMLEVAALLYLLLPYRFNRRLPGQIFVLRWLTRVQHWIMQDVFLLGVLVTTVKLGDSATVHLGPGMPLFFVLVALLQAGYWVMDKQNLWNWLYANNCFVRDPNENLYDCDICKAMVGESIVKERGNCPRCETRIYTRIPDSLQKTAALILASIVLYIPANLYPIMHYDELATNYDSTIWSGVVDLAANDLWLIAIVVFVASMVVPILKLMMLIFLVWSIYVRMTGAVRLRFWMYRTTKFIGRWSMVDVYVVTLLTAVVQFGLIGQVEPGAALLPFAAVVVLTMLAAETFDPRLIWDNAAENDPADARVRSLAQLNAMNLTRE